jgi:hypothetical protein
MCRYDRLTGSQMATDHSEVGSGRALLGRELGRKDGERHGSS